MGLPRVDALEGREGGPCFVRGGTEDSRWPWMCSVFVPVSTSHLFPKIPGRGMRERLKEDLKQETWVAGGLSALEARMASVQRSPPLFQARNGYLRGAARLGTMTFPPPFLATRWGHCLVWPMAGGHKRWMFPPGLTHEQPVQYLTFPLSSALTLKPQHGRGLGPRTTFQKAVH